MTRTHASTTPSTTGRRAASALAGLALAASGLAVGGAVTAGSADASGAAQRPAAAEVTATIDFDGSRAKEKLLGELKTPRKACKAQRNVKLFYKGPGDTGFNVVRSPETNNSGEWVQVEPDASGIPRGRYYVRIGAKGTTCKSDQSPTIRVR